MALPCSFTFREHGHILYYRLPCLADLPSNESTQWLNSAPFRSPTWLLHSPWVCFWFWNICFQGSGGNKLPSSEGKGLQLWMKHLRTLISIQEHFMDEQTLVCVAASPYLSELLDSRGVIHLGKLLDFVQIWKFVSFMISCEGKKKQTKQQSCLLPYWNNGV